MVNNNIGENGQRRMPGRGERRPKKPQTATPLSHIAPGRSEHIKSVLEELEGDEDGAAAVDVGARGGPAHAQDSHLPLDVQLV